MAKRYVVLEFEDSKDAQALIDAVRRQQAATAEGNHGGHVMITTPHAQLDNQFSVSSIGEAAAVGLYHRPTLVCTCRQDGKWAKGDGYTKGVKYGIWVHSRCGKPSGVSVEFWGGDLGLGNNLLNGTGEWTPGLLRADGSIPDSSKRADPRDRRPAL